MRTFYDSRYKGFETTKDKPVCDAPGKGADTGKRGTEDAPKHADYACDFSSLAYEHTSPAHDSPGTFVGYDSLAS